MIPNLASRIEDLLPQTQCTKCGYAGCAPYARAIAAGEAAYNQCPPGGQEGVARLAHLLGRAVIPLNTAQGEERPRPRAVIDESLCIGCTLCIQACPVDAIVGAAKVMHTVIAEACTGCDLCVAPCPVDCIEMIPVTGSDTGWDAWSAAQADAARQHYEQRLARQAAERAAAQARAEQRATEAANALALAANTPPEELSEADAAARRKQAIIQAAIDRARLRRQADPSSAQAPDTTPPTSPTPPRHRS